MRKIISAAVVAAVLLLIGREARAQAAAIGIDGDTLRVAGERIRLARIDAPEIEQTCMGADGIEWECGVVAALALRKLIAGRSVYCHPQGRDRFGRLVAVCAAEGVGDLGAAMVKNGYALGVGGYDRLQDAAQAAGIGMWEGTFQVPADFRKARSAK